MDRDLVAQMARGDQWALGALYERHASEVQRIARALLKDDGIASDLVHDVFIEAWKRSDQFDPERGTVRGWLVVRTRSRALDKLRALGSRREVLLGDGSLESTASVEQAVDHLHLPDAFRRVSPEERVVLALGYFEGLSCAEMSERLKIPVGTIKSRTRTAMKKLRAF